jgi:enolase
VGILPGDKSRYGGKGVTKAVDNINKSIRTAVTGLDGSHQRGGCRHVSGGRNTE